MRFLDTDEANEPIRPVVDFVDLFMVTIGALTVVNSRNPVNLFATENVVVKKPNRTDIRITVEEG